MSFLKLVMIVLLKIYAAGKVFGKICLKTVIDIIFFQYVVCDQGKDRETKFFGVGDIQQKGKFQVFVLAGRPSPNSLLQWDILISPLGKL